MYLNLFNSRHIFLSMCHIYTEKAHGIFSYQHLCPLLHDGDVILG